MIVTGFLLAILVSATLSQTPQAPWLVCPRGYHRAGPRCYLIVQEQMNWMDAEKHCRTLKATLLALETKEEYFLVKALIGHLTPTLPPKEYDISGGSMPHFWTAGYYNYYRKEALWHSSVPVKSRVKVVFWEASPGSTFDSYCIYWNEDHHILYYAACTYLFYGSICERDPVAVPPVG